MLILSQGQELFNLFRGIAASTCGGGFGRARLKSKIEVDILS
jgi:hypothetical protein